MAKGQAAHKKYLSGKNLTKSVAITAKCFECMGHYDDGPCDCEIVKCPLYPFMPYGKIKVNKPKKKSSRTGTKLSDDQKAKMLAGRRNK